MQYQNTITGRFLDRPNRFIAHVEIEGVTETVHVKNTGRCRELLLPGSEVTLQRAANSKRKTRYDLIAVHQESLGWVNIDSQAPNQVVQEWLMGQKEKGKPGEPDFSGITYLKPEYRYGDSRIDFYFEREGKCPALMEVKGVTLEREGIGYFPDAPTERGIKHIRELERAVGEGFDVFLAFVIQMEGISLVLPNDETHPQFGAALREARRNGLKVVYLGCQVRMDTMEIAHCHIAEELCMEKEEYR